MREVNAQSAHTSDNLQNFMSNGPQQPNQKNTKGMVTLYSTRTLVQKIPRQAKVCIMSFLAGIMKFLYWISLRH